jgi:hypothetical protein
MTTIAIRRKLTLLLSMLIVVGGLALLIAIRETAVIHTTPRWAGYVLQGTNGVTMVSARWTVPTLDCRITPNAVSTAWVGVGGFGHDAIWPFPQAGSDSNCVNGDQVDDFWCSHQTFKQYVVSPGDVIEARIFRKREAWSCSVNDVTAKRSDVKMLNYKYVGSTGTSEWIVESTTISVGGKSKIGKLADFGSLTFSDISISPGRLKPGDQESQDDIMMTGPNGQVIASPSWSAGAMTIFYK